MNILRQILLPFSTRNSTQIYCFMLYLLNVGYTEMAEMQLQEQISQINKR